MTDLLNVSPLAVTNWDSSLASVVDDMGGRPLNVHKLMAHNPALLAAWWNLRKHAVRGGRLEQRHRELIILRVAVHLKCWYEWASHVERGLEAGLTIEEIERVRRMKFDSAWSHADALVLQATDDCFREHRIRDETRRGMQRFFDLPQLMDLLAIIGVYSTLGTMINTWRIDLDEFVEPPQGISEAQWLRS